MRRQNPSRLPRCRCNTAAAPNGDGEMSDAAFANEGRGTQPHIYSSLQSVPPLSTPPPSSPHGPFSPTRGDGVGGVVVAFSRKRFVEVRRINPKVPKEEAVTISGRLLQILSEHGPLTIGNTWNHAKVPNQPVSQAEWQKPGSDAGVGAALAAEEGAVMRRKHAKSIKSKFNGLVSSHPPLNEAYSDVCIFSQSHVN